MQELSSKKSADYLPSWIRCSTEQAPHDLPVVGGEAYMTTALFGMVKVWVTIGDDTISRYCSIGATTVRV